MYILGVWDGHDSGAALIDGKKIIFASNEERFTKRKLEVSFPYKSINAALAYAGIKPKDIDVVAFPTTEFTKTLSRVFPGQKESYYAFRRRKMLRPRAEMLMHYAKYSMTGIGVLPFCNFISSAAVMQELRSMGFRDPKLVHVEHHASHAATAAFTSGLRKALVITLDGLGDGLSGTVSTFYKGRLERQLEIPASDSIGIFFEQVTNILGMRELEDEGKVMAMADYSYPFKFEENKLKGLFNVEGISIRARNGFIRQYDFLSRLSWSMPREQFAYMAQQLLEHTVSKFISNAMDEFGYSGVALAGGVFSNVKANLAIRMLHRLREWYIFPHMGDGGIALGAAMQANYEMNGVHNYAFNDAYLGMEYDESEIKTILAKEKQISYEIDNDKSSHAAELISDDNYVFWFQGRMEYGPRALGNRSILANAGSEKVKESLNMRVKRREWYQPFAPSILEEDAGRLLEDAETKSRFMTMAYKIKPAFKDAMKSAIHIDMTARPQMLGSENPTYRGLLERLKRKLEYGIALNTSLNIHGMPIAMSPEDAISAMKETKTRYMFIGDYFVENKGAD